MSTGMGILSQEIISLIASYLPRWEHNDRANISERGRALLPAFATISRSWQHAIEYQTFREMTIKSNELVEFSHIVVNHRRNLLRRLEINVILPTYTERACAKFEIYEDTQLNNLAFTKAIKDLLVLLRSWHDECRPTSNDNEASPQRSLRLCIGDCYSLMDCRYRGWEKYQEDRRESELGRRHDLFQHRYESSLLQLDSIEGIREIPQISSFHRSPGSRNIEPRSLAIIASRFPNLVSFRWRLQDNQKRDPRLSQQTRFGGYIRPCQSLMIISVCTLADSLSMSIEFAEALPMIPQGSLKRISLDLASNPPNNQQLNPSSALISSLTPTDHMSLAIHAISQSEHLTHLDLGENIVISPSLFWPANQTKDPFWPNLVAVKVVFSMTTAEGGWYFVRDNSTNDESDDDAAVTDTSSADGSEANDITTYQDPDPDIPDTFNEKQVALATGERPYRRFRSKADPDKLNPLFVAAAQAATQMPRLQRMMLKTEVKASKMFTFAMTYFAAGEKTGRGAGSRNTDKPRLDWVVGPSRYEPEESILEIWRGAKGEVLQSVTER